MAKKVLIYTTTVCPWCMKTKQFFKEHGVQYKEINVQEDENAAREMIEKTGQMGVPVIEIDGNIVIGYDISKLKMYLGIS